MAVVCPIALFAAVVATYNRLHLDNELVIGSAAGLSPWTLAEPAVRLSVLAMVAVLAVNLFVQPASYREMRDRLFEIRSDLATTLVREGQFRTPINNLTIYTQRVDRSGGLTNLVVSDSRNPADLITYVAREGAVVRVEGQPAISMRNGSLQRRTAAGGIEMVGFSTYVLELGEFGGAPEAVLYKPSDRYLHELFSPDLTSYWDRTHGGELAAEAWKRLSSPLLGLAAVLIALTCVIGTTFSRKGYGRQIAGASAQLVVLLLMSAAAFTLAEDNPALAPLQLAVPLVPALVAAVGLGLFRRAPARTIRPAAVQGRPAAPGTGRAEPVAASWDRVLEQTS
jgi:lipopolysaccharide export system permease protein